jgi:hypothetical protein
MSSHNRTSRAFIGTIACLSYPVSSLNPYSSDSPFQLLNLRLSPWCTGLCKWDTTYSYSRQRKTEGPSRQTASPVASHFQCSSCTNAVDSQHGMHEPHYQPVVAGALGVRAHPGKCCTVQSDLLLSRLLLLPVRHRKGLTVSTFNTELYNTCLLFNRKLIIIYLSCLFFHRLFRYLMLLLISVLWTPKYVIAE